ncbi:hypothetical protein [Pseudooceanicola batsensis]|nr:hypothetical protein [Pseudooceanicola batsensis]
MIEIAPLRDLALEALAAFDLSPVAADDMHFDWVRIYTGPISLRVRIEDGACASETLRLRVEVETLREGEIAHPQAETAILAEILSLFIERLGGVCVDWEPAGLEIGAARFQAAFTPMRQRGPDEMPRVMPRRVRPGWARSEPMTTKALIRTLPERATLGLRDSDAALSAVFRMDEAGDPAAEATATSAARAAGWVATASVGIMNPALGIPLAAYNAMRGADVRLSTHAFALTAVLSGLGSPAMAYLSMF